MLVFGIISGGEVWPERHDRHIPHIVPSRESIEVTVLIATPQDVS